MVLKNIHFVCRLSFLFAVWLVLSFLGPLSGGQEPKKPGVQITFRLPVDGPLPRTYRVTLAITDAKDPDWIVSTFLAGAARVVTAENQGNFTETWDGLDDNFMPVPPGTYGVKGIYMAAQEWEADGEWHSIVPRFVTEASAWRALPGEAKVPVIQGDPVNSPFRDVDIGSNGIGTFCYQYLENSRNFYVVDFNRPINHDQVLASYNSGGAAGGPCVATDGTTSWVYENEGFVFRTDQKPFGKENGRYRKGVYHPKGYVTAMAAWKDKANGKSIVYLAERGQLLRREKGWPVVEESKTQMLNRITALDGTSAARLAEVEIANPLGLVARWGDRLWVLHREGESFVVSSVPLANGLPDGKPVKVMTVSESITPTDLEVDSRGKIYLADARANKVYQFGPGGQKLQTFGRLDGQKPGSYDPDTFMAPTKLACWRNAEGQDRLIIIEHDGPNRVSEWDPETGKRLREWLTAQTHANDGYAVDPHQPDRIYARGQGGSLIRWRVDYESGAWQVEAVWPGTFAAGSPLGWGARHSLAFPRILYHGEKRYLAFDRGAVIFREVGDRWLPSAAILGEYKKNKAANFIWRDVNGDGQVHAEEYRNSPTTPPPGTMRYWGESWQDDFSWVAIQEGSPNVWRLAPTGFDQHGNPIFAPDGWTKTLTDPMMEARKKGNAPALRGGNEVGDSFNSAWAMVAGSPKEGFWVNARSGPNFSANFGGQHKLSHYVPDEKGGYRLQWRVGRVALRGNAAPGEVYGSIHLTPPIGGLITIIDQSRMGALLYTEDGLYVDTLFADERKIGKRQAGPYTQPGEFFAGYAFLHRENGKVYLAIGKPTMFLFELLGWTGSSNPVRRLPALPSVTIKAAQIATAPEFALALRRSQKGGTTAPVARFAPLPGGGPALDGSLAGWESCEPITFRADDKQTVEVRCGYDPDHLYLRWHARLGRKFETQHLSPVERIFTHDRHADTLSFYVQGDPNAPPARNREGRPGDARFVFGIGKDELTLKPVVLAMYPKWPGPKASPLTYRTPVGSAVFEHVGLLEGAKVFHLMDADGQGFVIAAALPRTALPELPFTGGQVTEVNFDATFGGHNRFWWSNADGSATRETYDEPTEAHLYPGSWAQGRLETIDSLPVRVWSAIGPFGFAELPKLHHLSDRPTIVKRLAGTSYPPEHGIDLEAVHTGDLTQTRRQVRKLTWRPASISGEVVKFQEAIDWQGYEDEGVAYLLTYIFAPKATEVKLRAIDGHGHHTLHAWLNDQSLGELPRSEKVREEQKKGKSVAATRVASLQAGWNKLLVRYDLIWGENALGVRLDAAPEILWQLRFAAQAPKKP